MTLDRDRLLSWFTPEELIDCPKCGAHTVITSEMTSVCVDCGVIERQVVAPEAARRSSIFANQSR